MNSRSIDTWVGLFVLAGLVALISLAFQVGNISLSGFDDNYRVYAKFDDVGGLNVRAPVSIAGVRVGRVTDITMDKEAFQAVVEISISSEYSNIPADSSARILTAGLLGAQFVGITPGGDYEALIEGSEIELTQSAISLENIISKFLYNFTTDGS